MKITSVLRLLVPLALGAAAAHATVQAISDIQGYVRVNAPANTDTLVSPIFGRTPAWSGTIQSVSGSQLTVSGTPAWTTNQFAPAADTYYVRGLSGGLGGHFFTVMSNDAGSITVDGAGMDLTQFAPGDPVEIAPYWSLGTFYPASQAGVTFVASTSALVRQTELLVYDSSGTGMNRAPSTSYFFFNGAWRKAGSSITTSFNSVVIPPDSYLLQRNKTASTTLSFLGRVHPGWLTTVVEAASTTRQDNYVALGYPMDLTLRQAGLSGGPAFANSASSLSPTDELLVFDPTQTGFNRAPSATYIYLNNGWRKLGASLGTDFSDTVTLPAGSGFIIRKVAGGTTGSWSFNTNL